MNFGQNLYTWFLSNAQSLVLMAIVVIGIYLGLLLMPQFIGITGVWLAVPIAEILTLCISLYLNFRLWLSWNNQNNVMKKYRTGRL